MKPTLPIRVVVIGLLLCGWVSAPLLASAADSVAIEVAPTQLRDSATADYSPLDRTSKPQDSVAIEMTDLATFSFRVFPPVRRLSAGWHITHNHRAGDFPVGTGNTVCLEAEQLVDEANHAALGAGGDVYAWDRVKQSYLPLLAQVRNELEQINSGAGGPGMQSGGAGATVPESALVRQGEVSRVIAKVEDAIVMLDRDAGPLYSIDNTVHGELLEYEAWESKMTYLPWGTPTQVPEEPRYVWEIEGEIGFTSGTSTYADREGQQFELSETLVTRSGKEYEFFQEYEVDHSYVNSNELTIGASQDFDKLIWDGDLRLTEAFSNYEDAGLAENNRQEGLFRLRFDPEWYDGRLATNLDYKYNVKVYETFSPRSYILNSAKFRTTWEASKALELEGRVRFDDYNYSIGSTRGNNKFAYGNTWTWEPGGDVRITAAADREEKTYNIRKTRSYEKLTYSGGVRWDPDDSSTLELKGTLTDYDRVFNPDSSYEDGKAEVRYRRDLTAKLDVDVRLTERRKEFDIDPLDDLDTHAFDAGLNFNPDHRWNFRFDWRQTDYDYANPNRAYERQGHVAGVGYSAGDLRATVDWRRSENLYRLDPLRDYTKDDYSADFDYSFNAHRLRVYYGVGLLDQADPASLSDYTETRLGAEWRYELCEDVDLRVRYDSSEREYDARDNIEDTSLEAMLSFEF